MSRKTTIRLFHKDGTFSHWISPDDFAAMMANDELTAVYEERPAGPHLIGYTKEVVCKSNPNNSQACLTLADMLAAIGLSRFRYGTISKQRQDAARAKVEEFFRNRSWAYRGPRAGYGVTMAERLPEMAFIPILPSEMGERQRDFYEQ